MDNTVILNLGSRMKMYEQDSLNVVQILPYLPFLIRLDGRSFSTLLFTLKKIAKKDTINKPYHCAFNDAMVDTCNDILNEFCASTVYTHSDEITVIFPQVCSFDEYTNGLNKTVHTFNGRVVKLLTCLASFTSVKFVFHLKNQLNKYSNEEKTFIDKYIDIDPKFTFDARILVFPIDKQYEFVNHMIWRSKFDCYRNFVGMYVQQFMNHKEVQGMSTIERVKQLKNSHNIDIDTLNVFMRYGVYVKKIDYDLPCSSNDKLSNYYKNNKNVGLSMQHISCANSNEYLDILMSKTYNSNNGDITVKQLHLLFI